MCFIDLLIDFIDCTVLMCLSVCMCRPARCFYIVSQWNGKVLDVRGDEASAGAALIVYDRKPVIATNQVWYEDELGLLRSKLNGYVIDTSCKQ